jgi:hypothetical protein
MKILDQHGRPLVMEHLSGEAQLRIAQLRDRAQTLQVEMQAMRAEFQRTQLQAKYDAAQTFVGNAGHWSNADHLDPNSVASPEVRRTLRSRSRYEALENAPYLKGTLLSICNDFVGRGPKLQIIDERLNPDRIKIIEKAWARHFRLMKFRRKLWQARMAKIVDGESFLRAFQNPLLRKKSPVILDFQVIETDRVSSPSWTPPKGTTAEIDGVRIDRYDNPTHYHILRQHPGGGTLFPSAASSSSDGSWVNAEDIIHWFRPDRPWVRGIPELAPSLPLCALLRRYTLALVEHAEIVADFTAIIETEAPAGYSAFQATTGETVMDTPFASFPVSRGMVTSMPFGYKIKQLESVPLGTQYDEFVGSILREICRPLLTPYHMVSGTSKDANMSAAVVDSYLYRGGQTSERTNAEEEVVDKALDLWWFEATRTTGYLKDDGLVRDQNFREEPPEHVWRWDRVGVDHTDPSKVAAALETMHTGLFMTDRDIQETHFNRDLETWQKEIEEQMKFRNKVQPPEPVVAPGGLPPKKGAPGKKSAVKKAPAKKAAPK